MSDVILETLEGALHNHNRLIQLWEAVGKNDDTLCLWRQRKNRLEEAVKYLKIEVVGTK